MKTTCFTSLMVALLMVGCAKPTKEMTQMDINKVDNALTGILLQSSPILEMKRYDVSKELEGHDNKECVVSKLTRHEITKIYSKAASQQFTHAETVKLIQVFNSDLGKRGTAQTLKGSMGLKTSLQPLSDREFQSYGMQTLPFWLKSVLIIQDKESNKQLSILVSKKDKECMSEMDKKAN